MKPSDFIFHAKLEDVHGDGPKDVIVCINPASQTIPLRDHYTSEELDVLDPLFEKFGLLELGSSVFMFEDNTITLQRAKEILIDAGMSENEEFSQFLDEEIEPNP